MAKVKLSDSAQVAMGWDCDLGHINRETIREAIKKLRRGCLLSEIEESIRGELAEEISTQCFLAGYGDGMKGATRAGLERLAKKLRGADNEN